jgi:glycosyltransferase involved in cell wall biosynthesis
MAISCLQQAHESRPRIVQPCPLTEVQAKVQIDLITQATAAATVFEQAKRDFDARDYPRAVIRAQEADRLVSAQVNVTDRGVVSSPIYSIIIVTYRDIPDVSEALSRLGTYSRLADYEIIIINNGNPAAHGIASNYLLNFRWIEVGFNYCCSGARNLGARAARGDFLVFIDDDGFIAEGAIENIIGVIGKHQAVMVRGRVLPKSTSGIAGPNYDLGDEVVISGPNAECLLICRRDEYLKHGGFDTLLEGHEGWALCSKMLHVHGPESFLYAPGAVIFHDYAKDAAHAYRKRAKYSSNKKYLELYYPDVQPLKELFRRYRADKGALR